MKTQAKICGLSEPATLDAAVAGGASHVGFVFFARSPRNVLLEQVPSLAARVHGNVLRAGVFVDPDDDLLTRAVAAGRLDVIQLHGDESPARVAAVKELTGKEVWKAIAVRARADIDAARRYAGSADLLLFDAKPPKGADLPGGLGLRFDWRLLGGYRAFSRWGLSGGLDPANVGEAIATTGARLVDVSSGVETAPGIKSVERIAAFLKAVKMA